MPSSSRRPTDEELQQAGYTREMLVAIRSLPNATSKKPFACDMCSSTFSKIINLRNHQLAHSGVRPFACRLCSLSFTRLHDLKRHELLHRGDRPFQCEFCHRTFARQDALNRHQRAGGHRGPCAGASGRYPVAPDTAVGMALANSGSTGGSSSRNISSNIPHGYGDHSFPHMSAAIPHSGQTTSTGASLEYAEERTDMSRATDSYEMDDDDDDDDSIVYRAPSESTPQDSRGSSLIPSPYLEHTGQPLLSLQQHGHFPSLHTHVHPSMTSMPQHQPSMRSELHIFKHDLPVSQDGTGQLHGMSYSQPQSLPSMESVLTTTTSYQNLHQSHHPYSHHPTLQSPPLLGCKKPDGQLSTSYSADATSSTVSASDSYSDSANRGLLWMSPSSATEAVHHRLPFKNSLLHPVMLASQAESPESSNTRESVTSSGGGSNTGNSVGAFAHTPSYPRLARPIGTGRDRSWEGMARHTYGLVSDTSQSTLPELSISTESVEVERTQSQIERSFRVDSRIKRSGTLVAHSVTQTPAHDSHSPIIPSQLRNAYQKSLPSESQEPLLHEHPIQRRFSHPPSSPHLPPPGGGEASKSSSPQSPHAYILQELALMQSHISQLVADNNEVVSRLISIEQEHHIALAEIGSRVHYLESILTQRAVDQHRHDQHNRSRSPSHSMSSSTFGAQDPRELMLRGLGSSPHVVHADPSNLVGSISHENRRELGGAQIQPMDAKGNPHA
ncbi:hypothetical protein BSLG_001202 [Batrachochytrium salamandrivorans]|nr:hypothetical protein BSLG_001202 [Batrachochytrium salamandrivorans]